MKIIDSHIHFWNPSHLRYDWLAGDPALNRQFEAAEFYEASNGLEIVGVIFVQADCLPEQALDEALWVAALDVPLKGIVAFAPLENGESARPMLETLTKIPLVKGIRRLIQSQSAGFAAQPDFVAGVRMLAEFRLSFDLCIRHHQLPDVLSLVEHCPDVHFVLDHIGKPDIAKGELDPWRAQITQLAQHENVFCKLSGMMTEAPIDWQPEDLRPYVEHVLATFGMERVMFGSDWPVCNLAGGYARWVETLEHLLESLTDAQKQAVFADNAARFYQLGN